MMEAADMERARRPSFRSDAPLEPPPPAPHSDADPNYSVYTTD